MLHFFCLEGQPGSVLSAMFSADSAFHHQRVKRSDGTPLACVLVNVARRPKPAPACKVQVPVY